MSAGDRQASSRPGLVLVAGLTRCGTSLLMQMLHAGGFPVVHGHSGSPGFEHPANLGEGSLSAGARGALKWLDPQQWAPPRAVLSVYLGRDKAEQAKSMAKFFGALSGEDVPPAHVLELETSLREDEPRALKALRARGPVYVTSFETLLSAPGVVLGYIAGVTRHGIDVDAALSVMRPRGPRCLPFLLEERLIADGATP